MFRAVKDQFRTNICPAPQSPKVTVFSPDRQKSAHRGPQVRGDHPVSRAHTVVFGRRARTRAMLPGPPVSTATLAHDSDRAFSFGAAPRSRRVAANKNPPSFAFVSPKPQLRPCPADHGYGDKTLVRRLPLAQAAIKKRNTGHARADSDPRVRVRRHPVWLAISLGPCRCCAS